MRSTLVTIMNQKIWCVFPRTDKKTLQEVLRSPYLIIRYSVILLEQTKKRHEKYYGHHNESKDIVCFSSNRQKNVARST